MGMGTDDSRSEDSLCDLLEIMEDVLTHALVMAGRGGGPPLRVVPVHTWP